MAGENILKPKTTMLLKLYIFCSAAFLILNPHLSDIFELTDGRTGETNTVCEIGLYEVTHELEILQ